MQSVRADGVRQRTSLLPCLSPHSFLNGPGVPMAVIDVEGLYKIFGDQPERARALVEDGASKAEVKEKTGSVIAVNDATFEVRAQEIFVVMGLSGSGKSTLLRCVNRLIEPTYGRVRVDGEDVTQYDDEALRRLRRTKMSMVFQNFGLFPHRSVLGNVEYGLEVAGVGRDERREKARRTLETVGLAGYEDSMPDALSGGMQQRVGLARALVNDPEILLMDEAFSALDPLIRTEMQEELVELQEQWDPACTILFITHDLDEALKLGDRIAIMKEGRIAQVGTPTEILTAPADDYVRSFVQNVDRTRALPATAVMRDPTDEERALGDDRSSVSPRTPIVEILPLLLDAEGPILVRGEEGTVRGVVDRDAVLDEILRNAGADAPDRPAPTEPRVETA